MGIWKQARRAWIESEIQETAKGATVPEILAAVIKVLIVITLFPTVFLVFFAATV